MIITLLAQDGIWSEIGMHDLQAYRGGKAALLRNTSFAKSRTPQGSKYKHDLHLSVGQRLVGLVTVLIVKHKVVVR